MTTSDDPLALSAGARSVLARQPTSSAHRRGCGFLARQAIEMALRHELGAEDQADMKWKSRFLVLGDRLPAVAHRGRALWAGWSEVCHYRPYDLVPDAATLNHWIDETESWLRLLAEPQRPSAHLERRLHAQRLVR